MGRTPGSAVRYVVGENVVTKRVAEGTYETGPRAPGSVFEMELTASERTGSDGGRFVCRVRVRSVIAGTRWDVVRAIVYTGPLGCMLDGGDGYREGQALRCVS
jgi:hypothetical protein